MLDLVDVEYNLEVLAISSTDSFNVSTSCIGEVTCYPLQIIQLLSFHKSEYFHFQYFVFVPSLVFEIVKFSDPACQHPRWCLPALLLSLTENCFLFDPLECVPCIVQ